MIGAMYRGPRGERGFTLVETLMAMSLAGAFLLPASFWLYHSRSSRAALEKFRATQALQTELHRALVLRLDHDTEKDVPGPPLMRLSLHVRKDADEVRISGKATDRKGRSLAELEAAYFGDGP
jgi:prepilin-type N-terminal cleavage/methylation domain-containing protein